MSTFNNIFNELLKKNNVNVTDEQSKQFKKLFDALVETNKLYNLTAVTSEDGVAGLHFTDSLLALEYIDQINGAAGENSVKNLLDIGCGAGFPCLPLAITRPDISVLGVDSTAKKVDFSSNFAKNNGISNFSSLSARAEELAKTEKRESFDLVTARAVARLNILAELTLPFVKVGGYFLAMKGSQGKTELEEAKNGIEKLGGEVVKIEEKALILPNESQMRTFILIKKVNKTPEAYPRAYGKIKKSPLK